MLTKNFASLHLCGFALNSRLARAFTLLLLLALFAQGMTHIRRASLTFDEGPHLAVGYTTLRTGDLRLQPIHIHPPLANVWAAGPLLLQSDLPDPRAIEGWEISSLSAVTDAVVWQYPHPARLALAGRLPILLLTLLLGALVYRWSRDLGGRRSGLLALTLLAFDPNIIAHGTLVTTDMAAVLLMTATLYVMNLEFGMANLEWRMTSGTWGAKRGWRLAAVGALLGLAQLTKVSALLLVPVVGLLVILETGCWKLEAGCRTQDAGRRMLPPAPLTRHLSTITFDVSRFTFYVLCVFGTAALVIWAGYGFEVGGVPGAPIPLPAATHFRIFHALRDHYAVGHATFALGRVSSHGWWWYFPVAFLLKTPLPVLLLLGLQIAKGKWQRANGKGQIAKGKLTISRLTLFLFPALYTISSLFSSVNIGYRHLLPVLPFLYVGMGQMANGEWRKAMKANRRPCSLFTIHHSRCSRHPLLLTLLLAWLILGTLASAPNYLAFFNALAGGPENGYRHLVDSNLDWGQNLWQLRDWMTATGAERVYYAHYSPAQPQTYGITADFLPPDPRAVEFTPWRPAPGVYALGATVLQGPYATVNTYAWFRARPPTAQLGHALFVYQVEPSPPPTWGVLCAGVPFAPETLRARLALPDLRVTWFDCTQASVYPAGGRPGVLLAHAEETTPRAASIELVLRSTDGRPEYALYRLPGAPPQPETRLPDVAVEGPLDFLGYTLTETDAAIVLEAHWRVRDVPGRPLSLLAHLLGPEGTGVIVGDGLGFPIEQWLPGDVLVQRHVLALPAEAPPGAYTLHTGGYWLDTLERWPITDADGNVTDSLQVQTLSRYE